MKKIVPLLLLALMLSVPANADEWTREDTTYQAALMVLKGIDWLQTKEIVRNSNYYEINPIMGKYPSQNTVDLYFACSAIGQTVLAYYLPKKYRRICQIIFIGNQFGCVWHNYNIGIRIGF